MSLSQLPEPGNVALRGKRALADLIKLRILSWEDYPGLSRWTQGNQKGSYNRAAGMSVRETWNPRIRSHSDVITCFEDRGEGAVSQGTHGHL